MESLRLFPSFSVGNWSDLLLYVSSSRACLRLQPENLSLVTGISTQMRRQLGQAAFQRLSWLEPFPLLFRDELCGLVYSLPNNIFS
jgi:hypothetical protein